MARPKGTTKNKGQKDSFDRFYTDVGEARRLFGLLLEALDGALDNAMFVEPSAGDGAFVSAMEAAGIPSSRILALDINPASETQCESEIRQHDFLADDFQEMLSSLRGDGALAAGTDFPIVFVGNPPFGEQCKTAIEFANRALGLGRHCAFILPPSFHKESIQRKLNGRVTHVFPIENIDYRVDEDTVSVPSAFFVMDAKQDFVPLPDYSDKLPFTRIPMSKKDEADFAIRRIGGTTGTAREDVSDIYYVEGHYFYKRDDDCPEDIIDVINSCDFPERDWSVGPRSLSSKEIAKNVYEKLVELGIAGEGEERA